MLRIYEKDGLGNRTHIYRYVVNGHTLARCCDKTLDVKVKLPSGKEITREYRPFCMFNSDMFEANMPPLNAKKSIRDRWWNSSFSKRAAGLPYQKQVHYIESKFTKMGVVPTEYTVACI